MTVDMDYFSLYESYQQKYNHLKQKFIEISSLHVNATNLQTLKEFYDSAINSKRASDDIKDLPGLIKTLEKRSVLSYNRIEPLKHLVTTFVKDPVLVKAIKEYELQLESQRHLPSFNLYKCKSGEYSYSQRQENFSKLIEVNTSEESLNGSEDSRLLNSETINHHLQSSTGKLLNKRANNQINNLPYLSSSNLNWYSFNNINNVNNINTISNNNNHYFLNGGFNDLRSKCSIPIVIIRATIVLIVAIIVIFITIYLKPSALATSSISSSALSTTDAPESFDSSQPQLSSGRIASSNPTTTQPTHQPRQQVPRVQESSAQPSELQIKVFQYLSENLGRSWRDLSRFMGVKEAEIDSIDSKSSYEPKDKAFEALEIFRARCDPCNWRKILIQSLETVRRKDLAEHVIDMIIENENE